MYRLHDPWLSTNGYVQCHLLASNLEELSLLRDAATVAVISSPSRRTLTTARFALGWLLEEGGIQVVADADWQGEIGHVTLLCIYRII